MKWGGTEIDEKTNFVRGTVSVTMGKKPYNGVQWASSNEMNIDTGGAVELAREFYTETNTKYGVVSTLTYGVQWDTTLAWIKRIKGESFNLLNSTDHGNYRYTPIAVTDFNKNAQYIAITGNNDVDIWTPITETTEFPEERNSAYRMTTGALRKANICNIYDMAGNMMEWTMEGYSLNNRVRRGASYNNNGAIHSIVTRSVSHAGYVGDTNGFRPSLYIK